MRIALFGGTGFVGTYLTDECFARGHEPVLLVRPGSEGKVIDPEHCRMVAGDLRDESAVDAVLAGCDAAVYAVGIIREFPRRGITYDALHLRGFMRVADRAASAGVRRLLLVSAHGSRPDGTPYQRSKHDAETYLRASPLEGIIIRPSVVFGDPRGRYSFTTTVRDDIVRLPLPAPLFHRGVLPRGAGKFRLAPVHVKDVAAVTLGALEDRTCTSEAIDLCGPESLTWREVIARVARASGRWKLFIPVPAGAVSVAAALFDRYPWFPITREQITMLLEGNSCDSHLVFARFGIDPTPFDEAHLDYLRNT